MATLAWDLPAGLPWHLAAVLVGLLHAHLAGDLLAALPRLLPTSLLGHLAALLLGHAVALLHLVASLDGLVPALLGGVLQVAAPTAIARLGVVRGGVVLRAAPLLIDSAALVNARTHLLVFCSALHLVVHESSPDFLFCCR